jgi:hypothetical protein
MLLVDRSLRNKQLESPRLSSQRFWDNIEGAEKAGHD